MPTVSRDVFELRQNVPITALQDVLNERAKMRGWRLIAIIPRAKPIAESVHVLWAKTEQLVVDDPVDAVLGDVFTRVND